MCDIFVLILSWIVSSYSFFYIHGRLVDLTANALTVRFSFKAVWLWDTKSLQSFVAVTN